MNKKMFEMIINNKERFVPLLFTKKQINLMQKYLDNAGLTNSEKAYLYSTIKKKTDALALLKEEYHITGAGMIAERAAMAKVILK
ncbi:hypothetical protein HZB03_03390, partial [Candidatus Woesearchaeota archaeon]|nr:hypothetical protein [Candidatus Woesearchaeota archaeon]